MENSDINKPRDLWTSEERQTWSTPRGRAGGGANGGESGALTEGLSPKVRPCNDTDSDTGIGAGRSGHGHAKVPELSCIKIAAEGLR